MRLIIDDTYFNQRVATAELHALLLRCVDGPHLLETVPLPSLDGDGAIIPPAGFGRWIDSQGEPWSLICRHALEISLRWTYAWQPRKAIRLHDGPDDWTQNPPRLSPTSCLRLFQLPLMVVVEDAVNDGHFVRAMVRPEFASTWQDAERLHWLEFGHGGGIDTCKRLVDRWSEDPYCSMRRFVIFDSDAREMGVPSVPSNRLRDACNAAQMPRHQLARRSIENYLPQQALRQWAYGAMPPMPTTPRVPVFNALYGLPLPLRYCYNYKHGRRRDRKSRGAKQTEAWAAVSLPDRRTLLTGVHPDIAALFDPKVLTIKPRWIEAEDVDSEMLGMIREVLANL